MKINLLFVYRKYKKDIHDAVDEIMIDFPTLSESNIIIHMWPLNRRLQKSFASHRNVYGDKIIQEIKLNPKVFLFSNIEYKLNSVKDANYETVKDIIWHELGHSLQIYILCDYYNMDLKDYCKNKDYFFDNLGNSKKNAICYENHIKYYLCKCGWTQEDVKYHLGTYSIEEAVEFIPECFNNYYRLKNKSFFSKHEQETFRFVSAVVDDYKKYINSKTIRNVQ